MPPKKKKVNKKVQHGDGLYDWVANNVFGASMGHNEIHAPQYTEKGFRFGQFIGPGTKIYDNLRKGAKPVSNTDKTAKLHDIMFTLAETPEEVRAADLRMVKNLDRIQKEKSDYKFNIYMGKLPIKAKMLAEDWGIMKKGSFSGMNGAKVSKENRELLEREKTQLTQEGYGKGKKKKPQSAWLTHVAKVRAKHPGKSYKECLKLSSASYNKK
jgi:hypothetical protein